ncbi:TPA: hypothetical protein PXM28_004026, partial [Yersinia enterocolitica]|nr:hypothetical protein [Yersinia enterocolitica]
MFNANTSNTPLTNDILFNNNSLLNVTAPIIFDSDDRLLIFNDDAKMNLFTSNAITGGAQLFLGMTELNVSTSNAITGGFQQTDDNAKINASVNNAISGGTQYLRYSSELNASASNAIIGGTQYFLGNAALNATVSNAITGGTQTFWDNAILNATASHTIAGGAQTFWNNAILNAAVNDVIAGGTQVFNNDSQLKIGVDDAVAGSRVELNDNSQLLMQGHTAWVSSLAGNGGEVLGQGSTASTLTINGTHGEDTTFAGLLLNNNGTLNLVKDGTSRQTLAGVGSTVSDVAVKGGTLAFAQNGTFTTVGDYTTHTGATTAIGVDNATLTVGGAFTQQAGSTLDITVGASPDITADTAVLGGQLVINGFAEEATPVKASAATTTTYNLIHTAHGISGNFDNNPLTPTGLDYLLHDGHLSNNDHDYDMRFGLAWTDGLQRQSTGSFTVNAGTAFDIDTALADQIVPTGGFASGWDGRSLTKAGDGLLVLS